MKILQLRLLLRWQNKNGILKRMGRDDSSVFFVFLFIKLSLLLQAARQIPHRRETADIPPECSLGF